MAETNLEKSEYYKRLKKRMDQIYIGEGKDRHTMELSDLLGLINLSDRSFREVQGFKKDKIKSKEYQRVFTRTFIRALYLACQINPADFLIDKKQETAWLNKFHKKKELFFTHEYWNKIKGHFTASNSLIRYIRIESHDANSNPELETIYKKILAPYFLDAKHTVKVYEVLFKGAFRRPNEYGAYAKAQYHVLMAIQKWLDDKKAENDQIREENKKLKTEGKKEKKLLKYKYIRTLACMRSKFLFSKDGNENRKKAMVLEASRQTLKHLQYCMDNHPNHCEFWVTKSKHRRNHALIDDHYTLTEDYTTTYNDVVVPDGVFINNVSPTSKTHLFKKSIETGASNASRFTKANLCDYLIKGYLHVLKQSEKKLDDAERIRNELKLEKLADEEQEKGDIFLKYEGTTLKKIRALGYYPELEKAMKGKLKS